MSTNDKKYDKAKRQHEKKSPEAIEFGNRLKKVRQALDIMQKDLAAEIDVASSNVSNIEQGINKPGFDFLYKLSHRYNVNPFYLFHGKGPMFLEGTSQAGSISDTYNFGALTEMIEDLLNTMEKSNIVKLGILEFFHKYRIQQKSLIDAEINEYEDQKKK